jgi:hypothetical protein
MAGTLEERYGVAISGVSWDSGAFKLWQGQTPDVILFSVKQPMLAKSLTSGRYEMSAVEYRAQQDNTYKIVGGGAAFTVTTAIQLQQGGIDALKDQWRDTIAGSPDAPKNPIFVPLNTRHSTTELAIPTFAGKPSDLTMKANDAGTMGGTLTYMVDLTAGGAQEWGDAIRNGRSPVAQIMLQYDYLRYMPVCSVDVTLHGDRVFQHFSAHLNASYDGWLYGGSLDVKAQFESLMADGAIEMKMVGLDDLPGGSEKIKENLINTLIDQGLKAMLNILFQPKPDVKPAAAGDSGGLFGGANLALKWQREEQSLNLHEHLEFGGFTWLTERADPDLSMFAVLDESYVETVNTELQFPATVTVTGDEQVSTTAVAWNPSEGQSPQSPVFGDTGGTKTYNVTSRTPNDVKIDYTAKINYKSPDWPIVSTRQSGTVEAGLGNVLIKPSQWIAQTTIYLYIKDADGKGIKLIGSQAGTSDYLVVNATYTAPHLTQPLKASGKLIPDTPITFSYPTDPGGAPGKASFSAFGIVGGKLVHAAEQPIGLDETAVFVLVSDKGVQLVSDAAQIVESDELAQDLLRRRDEIVRSGASAHGHAVETEKSKDGHHQDPRHLHGTLVAVEYDTDGAAVWIDSKDQHTRVPLRDPDLAGSLRHRETVDVQLDADGEAESIVVELV